MDWVEDAKQAGALAAAKAALVIFMLAPGRRVEDLYRCGSELLDAADETTLIGSSTLCPAND